LIQQFGLGLGVSFCRHFHAPNMTQSERRFNCNFTLTQRRGNTSVLDNAAAWFNFSELE